MGEFKHIENSPAFQEYKKENTDAYLVHIFRMKKAQEMDEQVGYFSPTTKQVTTFSKEPVQLLGSDKTFNPEQEDIPPLDMSTVKVTVEQALSAAQNILDEHYRAQTVTQEICILQHLDTQVWNVTLVTNAFNLINIRVDAASGEIVSHEQRSIMDLGSRQ